MKRGKQRCVCSLTSYAAAMIGCNRANWRSNILLRGAPGISQGAKYAGSFLIKISPITKNKPK